MNVTFAMTKPDAVRAGNTGATMPNPIVSISTAASAIGTALCSNRMRSRPPGA